ncbi:MAG TPA: VanZ family protein [Bryobacteraceae bacterium]
MSALWFVIALIVGGSLYPWHFAASAINPWLVLMQSWPRQWSALQMLDASANVLVYIPLGAIAFAAPARRQSARVAAIAAIFLALFLSLGMELLQAYVPGRTSSLFDLTCNVAGASLGIAAAWRFRRLERWAFPPLLMLACWACYHLYPVVPMVVLSRNAFEVELWIHPPSISFVEIWSYAAEWLAVGIAVERLLGRKWLRWLPMVLVFHFVVRPIIPARPIVLEDLLGGMLALAFWNVLPERVRSSPWPLSLVVFLRALAPLHWYPVTGFSWIPFRVFLSSSREVAIQYLARALFDYAAILWLWQGRDVSYITSATILASTLAALVFLHGYLPGDVLSMTDPTLVVLAALIFSAGRRQIAESPISNRE